MGCCASEAQGTQNERLNDLGKLDGRGKDISMLGANTKAGRKKRFSSNQKLILGYWNIRGLAHPIRYLLEYAEHPYEEVLYEQGGPPNFSSQ